MSARADPLRNTLDHLALDPAAAGDRKYLVSMLRRLGYTEREIQVALGEEPVDDEHRVIELEYRPGKPQGAGDFSVVENAWEPAPQEAGVAFSVARGRLGKGGDPAVDYGWKQAADEDGKHVEFIPRAEAPAGDDSWTEAEGEAWSEGEGEAWTETEEGEETHPWPDAAHPEAQEAEEWETAPEEWPAQEEAETAEAPAEEPVSQDYQVTDAPGDAWAPAEEAEWPVEAEEGDDSWTESSQWSTEGTETTDAWAEEAAPAWDAAEPEAASEWETAEPEATPEWSDASPAADAEWQDAAPTWDDDAPTWADEPEATQTDVAAAEQAVDDIDAFVYGDFTLYTRMVELDTGKQSRIYFFSNQPPTHGAPCQLPAGYRVEENERTKTPFLLRDQNAATDGWDDAVAAEPAMPSTPEPATAESWDDAADRGWEAPAAAPKAAKPAKKPAAKPAKKAAAKPAAKSTKASKAPAKAATQADSCAAITNAGTSCSRSARDGSKYCGIHKGYRAPAQVTKKPATKAAKVTKKPATKAAKPAKKAAKPAKVTKKAATKATKVTKKVATKAAKPAKKAAKVDTELQPQCAGLTSKGDQCKRSSRIGSKYCISHKGYRPPTSTKGAKDTTPAVRKAEDTEPSKRRSQVTEGGYKLFRNGGRYFFSKKTHAEAKKDGAVPVYEIPDNREISITKSGLPVLKST